MTHHTNADCIQNTKSGFLSVSSTMSIFHDFPILLNRVVIEQVRFYVDLLSVARGCA